MREVWCANQSSQMWFWDGYPKSQPVSHIRLKKLRLNYLFLLFYMFVMLNLLAGVSSDGDFFIVLGKFLTRSYKRDADGRHFSSTSTELHSVWNGVNAAFCISWGFCPTVLSGHVYMAPWRSSSRCSRCFLLSCRTEKEKLFSEGLTTLWEQLEEEDQSHLVFFKLLIFWIVGR